MGVNGDKKAATKYLLAASKEPAADDFGIEVTLKLPVVLLKYGGPDERLAVIEYLERYGKLSHRPDVDLLRAARQLRQGYMPSWYQYQAASLK